MNKRKKNKLLKEYKNLLTATFGSYNAEDYTPQQQHHAIKMLTYKLSSYKTDPKVRKEFGILQPPEIIEQITKVPREVVSAIANQIGLDLPEEVDFDELIRNFVQLSKTKQEKTEELISENEILIASEEEIIQYAPEEIKEIAVPPPLPKNTREDPFEGTGTLGQYLIKLVDLLSKGKIKNASIVALTNDNRVSIWAPDSIPQDMMDIFSPIVDLMSLTADKEEVPN